MDFIKSLLLRKTYTPKVKTKNETYKSQCSINRVLVNNKKGTNLIFLLEKRYSWMNDWIPEDSNGVEVGCGIGMSKLFIKSKHYLLSDIDDYENIDLKVDALKLPYKNNSIDFIISSNMIHHLTKPAFFFEECKRILKPNGVVLIQEVYGSYFFRFVLRLFKHEGYNFDFDPFDKSINGSSSGNNVVPNLLFDDTEKFERYFNLKCIRKKHREFLIFIFSGGVIKKIPMFNLPRFVLTLFSFIDKILIKISKSLFAFQIQVVLKKTD